MCVSDEIFSAKTIRTNLLASCVSLLANDQPHDTLRLKTKYVCAVGLAASLGGQLLVGFGAGMVGRLGRSRRRGGFVVSQSGGTGGNRKFICLPEEEGH